MGFEEKLTALIEQSLQEADADSCFLVEHEWKEKPGKLVVFLDGMNGINLAQCQKVSRKLGYLLDESKLLDVNYALEVSSPGLDRPLKLHQQYVKNVGRPIKVQLVDGRQIKGSLDLVTDDYIEVTPEKKGKKKLPKEHIPFADIDKTFVQVRFK
ncbi:MAG: ribosome maturation factor [Saprospiraceae bacterium]|nr:ribosome maturation factor [Saprospiraceae bacterium]